MSEPNLQTRIAVVERYFSKSARYGSIVVDIMKLYEAGMLEEVKRDLRNLPTESQLLQELIEKLKGKSVYKTLKKLMTEGKIEKNYTTMKGLSSLLTHAIIEVEKGNVEYSVLFPKLLDSLNEILYSL